MPKAENTEQDGTDEEAMLAHVKNFDVEQIKLIKVFVQEVLPHPLAMHESFVKFRLALVHKKKTFTELPDLQAQLSFLQEVLEDMKVFPRAWLTYGSSTTFLYVKTSRFVEGTESVFQTSANLGQFVSLRGKYCILALRDLVRVKALKCTSNTEKALAEMSALADAETDASKDATSFTASLSAFDSATWLYTFSVSFALWC